MKRYESPILQMVELQTAADILVASEESFDINVSFDTLWGEGI